MTVRPQNYGERIFAFPVYRISGRTKVKNNIMGGFFKELKYYSDMRFTTLSGTLVYFFLTSITPFLFWLALIAGDVDLSRILPTEFFETIEPFLNSLQQAALDATGSATLLLLITSLWSSTNFFFHLRRSGELIFAPHIVGNSLKLRISSLFAVFAVLLLVALAAAVPFIGVTVLEYIMPRHLAEAITLVFLTLFAYFTSYFLNAFACPYRLSYAEASGGALLTVILWIACAIGFSIYLGFSDFRRLYGAIAAVIVFLLWCYLMINSLVIGVIYNAKHYILNDAAARKKAIGGNALFGKDKGVAAARKSVFDATAARKRAGADMHRNA